jgi:hypothetical protein
MMGSTASTQWPGKVFVCVETKKAGIDMKIVVLDHCLNSVDTITTNKEFIEAFAKSMDAKEGLDESELIEMFLQEHCQYDLDNCSWMGSLSGSMNMNDGLTERSFTSDFDCEAHGFHAPQPTFTDKQFLTIDISRRQVAMYGLDVSCLPDEGMEKLAFRVGIIIYEKGNFYQALKSASEELGIPEIIE